MRAVGAQALDRDDLMPLRVSQCRQAGADRLTIQMDSAGAAGTDAAAEFRPGQADDVANGPQQRHLRVGVDRMVDAIDLDLWQEASLSALLSDAAHFFSVLR